ncbi:DNA mismatch repair protein MutT OS=Streptomyces microflavus OX=1919 GN=Smic_01610 PE=4 SV=1 [Streptomyces microflavus]
MLEQAAERLIVGQRVFVQRLRAQVRGEAASPEA